MAEFYALIENDEIVKLNVPRSMSLKSVSFGVNSVDEDYAAYNYYPIVGEAPAYNPEEQILSQPNHVWNSVDEVVNKTYTITNIPLVDLIIKKQNEIKTSCEEYIFSVYPKPIQLSASLGIYTSTVVDTMVEFIAACIAEENRCYDELEVVLNVDELNLVVPNFPEVV